MAKVPGRATEGSEAVSGRRDPVSFDVGRNALRGHMKARDESRHYVLVPARGPTADEFGVQRYLAEGYRIERPGDGAEMLMKFRSDEADVVAGPYDTVLMSISKDDLQARMEYEEQRTRAHERAAVERRAGLEGDVSASFIRGFNTTEDLT